MATFIPTLPNTGTISYISGVYAGASFCTHVLIDKNTGSDSVQGYLHFDTSSIPDGATVTYAWVEYEVELEPHDDRGNSRLDLYQGSNVIGTLDVPPDLDWSLSSFAIQSSAIPHAVGVLYRIAVDPTLISLTAFSDFAFQPTDPIPAPLFPTRFRENFNLSAFKLIVKHDKEADNVNNF
jgi:hypothetical protein